MFTFDFNLDYLFDALGVIAFVITLFFTGSIKKAIKNLNEVIDLKYRNSSTRVSKTQTFSETVPDYYLDSNNELQRLPLDKNVQAEIQSYVDVALENVLNRLMPKDTSVPDTETYTSYANDLSSLAESIEIAEEYRDKFNLPDTYSISDIYSFVDKQAKALNERLALLKSNKEVKSDGSLPEKKIEPESK